MGYTSFNHVSTFCFPDARVSPRVGSAKLCPVQERIPGPPPKHRGKPTRTTSLSMDDGKRAIQRPAQKCALMEQVRRNGDPDAALELGMHYSQGPEIAPGYPHQNYQEMADWLLYAAVKGNSVACHQLGQLYYLGRGVPKDEKRGIQMVAFAANEHYDPAKTQMRIYRRGAHWRSPRHRFQPGLGKFQPATCPARKQSCCDHIWRNLAGPFRNRSFGCHLRRDKRI